MATDKNEVPHGYREVMGLKVTNRLRSMTGLPLVWHPESPEVITIEVQQLRKWMRDRGFGE